MVVEFKTKYGFEIHGPPYTKAEEAEFYRRVGGGPIAVYRRCPYRTEVPRTAGATEGTPKRGSSPRRRADRSNLDPVRPATVIYMLSPIWAAERPSYNELKFILEFDRKGNHSIPAGEREFAATGLRSRIRGNTHEHRCPREIGQG
jgi:hypothetical protein